MPIGYLVTTNKLTSPVSYYCRVNAIETLDFAEVAALLNEKNPTVPVAVALSILNDLRTVVKEQLLAGKTVNLTNFCSFRTTLPVKLVNPDDPLPENTLNVSGSMSTSMRDEMRVEAEFTREGYTSKEPMVISTVDIQRESRNTFELQYPFRVIGSNMKFDSTDSEQGIFLSDGTDPEERINIYSSIGNGAVNGIITEAFTSQGTGYRNEFSLVAKTKYTANGSIRTTSYQAPVRGRITCDSAHRGQIYSLIDGSNTFFATLNQSDVNNIGDQDYAYGELVIRRSTLGDITAFLRNYPQYGGETVTGDSIPVTADGLLVVPPVGQISIYNITIANFSDINTLLDKYAGELIEPLRFDLVAVP